MARYCVTYSEDDDWGESKDRFTTRPPADARLEEARIAGRFARLIRWDYKAVELARVNGHLAGTAALGEAAAANDGNQLLAATAREAVSAKASPATLVDSQTSPKEPPSDPHARLQRIKLLLEIAAVAITAIGGLIALIWKLQ